MRVRDGRFWQRQGLRPRGQKSCFRRRFWKQDMSPFNQPSMEVQGSMYQWAEYHLKLGLSKSFRCERAPGSWSHFAVITQIWKKCRNWRITVKMKLGRPLSKPSTTMIPADLSIEWMKKEGPWVYSPIWNKKTRRIPWFRGSYGRVYVDWCPIYTIFTINKGCTDCFPSWFLTNRQ